MRLPWLRSPVVGDAPSGDRRDGRATPGYGWCMRCGTSWDKVHGRSVGFGNGTGSFPLCELCWPEVSPSERLAYHVILWGEQHFEEGLHAQHWQRFWKEPDVADLINVIRCVMGASDDIDEHTNYYGPQPDWFPVREMLGEPKEPVDA